MHWFYHHLHWYIYRHICIHIYDPIQLCVCIYFNQNIQKEKTIIIVNFFNHIPKYISISTIYICIYIFIYHSRNINKSRNLSRVNLTSLIFSAFDQPLHTFSLKKIKTEILFYWTSYQILSSYVQHAHILTHNLYKIIAHTIYIYTHIYIHIYTYQSIYLNICVYIYIYLHLYETGK